MKSNSGIRLIAIFKILKGFLMLGVSFGIFRLIHADLGRVSVEFLNVIRLDPDNRHIREFLEKFVQLSPKTIERFGIAALTYSGLFLTEGFGLWFGKKWAKYLVIIVSGLLLPWEFHETFRHFTSWKLLILTINLGIIAYISYLVFTKKDEG